MPNGYNLSNGGEGVRLPSNIIPFRDISRLGDIIREYRLKNEMSMGDFAKKSRLSKPYISMLEANKNSRNGKSIVLR